MSNGIQISRKTHNYTNFMSVNQKITDKFIFYKTIIITTTDWIFNVLLQMTLGTH